MRTLIFLLVLFLPMFTEAARFTVSSETEQVGVGGHALVGVSLDTEGESINAFEGTIRLPEGVTLTEISLTGSLVPYWIEKPEEREPGRISFSGIFPGGVQTTGESLNNLFTLVVEGHSIGNAQFSLSDGGVYANDGLGTRIPHTVNTFTLNVSGEGVGTPIPSDTTQPESFEPLVASGSSYGLSGKVLVFVTQDKDSGIKGYSVARSFLPLPHAWLSFTEVESPLQLSWLDYVRFIYVRAEDAKGNTETAVVTPGSPLLAILPSLILILIVGALSFAYRAMMRRR